MRKVKEIKKNAIHKAMLKVFQERNVLFLENDFTLPDAVGNLEVWLIENKIKYNALFNVEALSMEYIQGQIEYADIIVFETTWGSEISHKIEAFLKSYKTKKTIVECYISEPSWWSKPKRVVHEMYVLCSCMEDMDEWEFDKLRINKPIWEK